METEPQSDSKEKARVRQIDAMLEYAPINIPGLEGMGMFNNDTKIILKHQPALIEAYLNAGWENQDDENARGAQVSYLLEITHER